MSLMSDMLKAGVHYGHKTSFWNPNYSGEVIFDDTFPENFHMPAN